MAPIENLDVYCEEIRLSLEDKLFFVPMLKDKVDTFYAPIYFEHYTLPFIRDRVKRDFGIELTDPTHVKMILERTR